MGWAIRFFAILLGMMLPSAAAHAEWREATTEHFVVVSGGSQSQLVQMAQRLEAVHWLLTQTTGARQSGPGARVRIYLVDSIDDVHDAMGLGSGSLVAGFYRPQLAGSIAVVPRDQSQFSTSILFHEYTHHFMLQNMPVAFPPWFVEGAAEVMSTASFEQEGTIYFGRPAEHRAYELQLDPWTPIPRMMAARSKDDSRAGVASYGQYWLAAHYFTFAPERRGQLAAYINAVNRGQAHEVAASEAFTGGLDQLNADLQRYLRRNRFMYQQVRIPVEVMVQPQVRIMRPGEAAIIDDELQASRYLPAADHLPIARRVAAVAVRYPDDPAVGMLHARLLFYAEQFAEAEAAADRVLALDPNHVRALTLKAQAMLRGRAASNVAVDPAFLSQAQAFITRASQLDPDDQVPLVALHESFGIAGQPASDSAIRGLFRASRLVPQMQDIRMTLSLELLNRRNLAAARALLGPLALSPHRNPRQAYALNLVQWLDAGAEGEIPVFVEPVANPDDD